MAAMSAHQPMEDNVHRELPAEDARQGETPGIVRYMLGVSLGLVVVAFAVIYLVG